MELSLESLGGLHGVAHAQAGELLSPSHALGSGATPRPGGARAPGLVAGMASLLDGGGGGGGGGGAGGAERLERREGGGADFRGKLAGPLHPAMGMACEAPGLGGTYDLTPLQHLPPLAAVADKFHQHAAAAAVAGAHGGPPHSHPHPAAAPPHATPPQRLAASVSGSFTLMRDERAALTFRGPPLRAPLTRTTRHGVAAVAAAQCAAARAARRPAAPAATAATPAAGRLRRAGPPGRGQAAASRQPSSRTPRCWVARRTRCPAGCPEAAAAAAARVAGAPRGCWRRWAGWRLERTGLTRAAAARPQAAAAQGGRGGQEIHQGGGAAHHGRAEALASRRPSSRSASCAARRARSPTCCATPSLEQAQIGP